MVVESSWHVRLCPEGRSRCLEEIGAFHNQVLMNRGALLVRRLADKHVEGLSEVIVVSVMSVSRGDSQSAGDCTAHRSAFGQRRPRQCSSRVTRDLINMQHAHLP